jgi:hypothetical protein
MNPTELNPGSAAQERRPLHHLRDPDFEPYDEIRIRIAPRFKTSGLSGDEWRTSAVAELYFKGQKICERSWSRLEWALAGLAAFVFEKSSPIEMPVLEYERTACDQPGCSERAVSKYRVKEMFSDRGEKLDMSEKDYADYYRQFCRRHLKRGDCSREDCDKNYEVISGPGPGDAEGFLQDVSPSGAGARGSRRVGLAGAPRRRGLLGHVAA